MSFNDLERGASPPPGNGAQGRRIGGALSGQALGRGNSSAAGGGMGFQSAGSQGRGGGQARGPLPLYHSPTSSSSSFAAAGNEQQQPDPEFKKRADRIGIQIFKLNSNVQGIDKLVELQTRALRKGGAAASRRGGANAANGDKDWTSQIHDLTETTRSLTKDLSAEVKELLSYASQRQEHLSSADRITVSKLQRDFEGAINAFARTQRESAKLSKSMLEGAKEERERTLRASGSNAAESPNQVAVNETLVQVDDEQSQERDQSSAQEQQQRQIQKSNEPSQAELEFQETLIAERESDIREIETGIHELNEIFRDLGHIVQEQGGMIDNIEYNITSIATNTGAADRELVTASDYQRRAGRRAACLLLIIGFVVAIVLLAILS